MTEYQEYEVEITDPYWKKHFNDLVSKGFPASIVRAGILKADAERSLRTVYQ